MTTEDEARLAGIRERCKSPPWQEHDIGFLLRLLDAARARIAQLDADDVQAQKDANVMIDEREAKVKRLEAQRDVNEQRAQKAELRLSQVENTIRGRMSHYDSYAVSTASIPSDRYVASVLADLLVDLGFEPEAGR